jgi:uncharacterized protein (TIGR00288 family)
MTAQFARTPARARPSGGANEPHAALLIDFDNVTMGIRSDLTKELKNLLNSDIIKGKVAVQRAYADWRRYPQYIVPLAESSVDLIFAPAYGSAKKNATDIRLAIDAVELVFTRPEIGTIILLSGDSDFSSLVLKLKEYGKYVIGVGIRESASDLLVQNCDEYYSYSALTGLTRAGDEAPVVSEDPWELVELAIRQMTENNDVMRSDRFKQVLLELDPGFDEKSLGFQKFNKFLQEAASRDILSLRKQENGQYEIGQPGEKTDDLGAEARSEGRGEGRSRRGRRGRGRRDGQGREDRDERDEGTAGDRDAPPAAADQLELDDSSEAAAAPETTAAPEAPAASAAESEAAPESAAEATAEATPERGRTRRGRGRRGAGASTDAPAADDAASAEPAAAAGSGGAADGGNGISEAYSLLRRAVSELTKKSGPAVRDSDVKRRMLELQPGWDESTVGFSKFSRFLRQAHDAQVVTLRKGENGISDVMLGDGGVHVEEDRGGRGRGRDRDREDRGGRERSGAAPAPRSEEQPAAATPAAATPAAAAAPTGRAAAEVKDTTPPKAVPVQPMGIRRGSRGRGAPSGPPPLLEGQAVGTPSKAASADSRPARDDVAPAAKDEAATAPAKGAGRKGAKKAAGGKPAASGAAPSSSGGSRRFDAAAFNLPTNGDAVTTYLSTNYKGIGPKTVEPLVAKVGPEGVFDALENKPDLVRDLVPGARGERLLELWADDIAFRRANAAPNSASTAKTAAAVSRRGGKPPAKGGPAKGGPRKGGARKAGPRKGGRSGGRSPAGK